MWVGVQLLHMPHMHDTSAPHKGVVEHTIPSLSVLPQQQHPAFYSAIVQKVFSEILIVL